MVIIKYHTITVILVLGIWSQDYGSCYWGYLSFREIEQEIKRLAVRREGQITVDDTGGTFTISNGGVFGSMLSTPIINPPQSAILECQYYRETHSHRW